MGPITQTQLAVHANAARLQSVDLPNDAGRVERHSAGDNAGDVVAENAAGNEGELPGLAVGDDGVAGVGAALVADDDRMIFGENIDEFAFGFVAPLQTDNTCAGHGRRSS